MIDRILGVIKNLDWILLGSVILLICFGLAAIYSIAISADQPDFGNFQKQIIFALIGLGLILIMSLIDYRLWQDYSLLIYLGVGALLLLVLFFGVTVSGTTGWFSLMGINFQPVELAKVALIIFLSWFLSHRGQQIKKFKNFFITALATSSFFFLVILQPDFGSGVMFFLIWVLLLLFAGADKKHLGVLALTFIVAAVVAWLFLFQDYQRERILTFLNPQSDPYNSGYHVRQAVTAVGAGGIFGRGLGFGSQSQLKFIPASQTDFIFAVIAEELGFFGVSLVLFFWGVIFYRLVKAARLMKDNFSAFFILGVTAVFFSHLMINIGMNLGLVPVTGISLPFLSYGGSFLVISLLMVGIIEGMIARSKT